MAIFTQPHVRAAHARGDSPLSPRERRAEQERRDREAAGLRGTGDIGARSAVVDALLGAVAGAVTGAYAGTVGAAFGAFFGGSVGVTVALLAARQARIRAAARAADEAAADADAPGRASAPSLTVQLSRRR